MIDRIQQIEEAAAQAVDRAGSSEELEDVRVELPRPQGRAAAPAARRRRSSPPRSAARVGKAANEARRGVEAALEARKAELDRSELDTRLAADVVDVTLPGTPAQPVGRLHLLTPTRREIEDIFVGLGFRVVEGPEVDTVDYNFDALNHDPTHPSRLWCGHVLRGRGHRPAHAHLADAGALDGAAPAAALHRRPGRLLPPRQRRHPHAASSTRSRDSPSTRTSRSPTSRARCSRSSRAVFGDEREIRFRPHFFPFTEPSVELDVSCFNCTGGFLRDGSRCPLCKGEAWIELLGAGEVDPNVFEFVREYGYDPERHQGFAWGMGIERIAMLKYGVPDMRLLYENDLRFLEQFG